MTRGSCLLLAALAPVLACSSTPEPAPAREAPAAITEYRGGHWFNGAAFVERTMWTVGGRFAAQRPPRVDTTVDLAGGYVVPPFGEGHNHWLEPALVETYIGVHLRHGIFYVRDLSTPPAFHDAIRSKVNRPGSVDYVAAHQGFTGPGGHPIELVEQLAQLGVIPAAWAQTRGEGDVVFAVASEADLDRAWPRLIEGRPDFVKVFLVHSDEYAARRYDPARTPKERGIDPALVPHIVRRARAAGLRVTAHIENAHDFHVAIAAGVDDLAHLPFVDGAAPSSYRIADADIRAAGARKVSIATTLDFLGDAPADDPRVSVTRDNLERLRAAGVAITIGTDQLRVTARAEAQRIAARGLMTNLELLVAWTMATPRAIVPDRDVGRLDDGAEASFLVLAGDPLADFAHTRAIVRWVKQGRELSPPAIEMPSLE